MFSAKLILFALAAAGNVLAVTLERRDTVSSSKFMSSNACLKIAYSLDRYMQKYAGQYRHQQSKG